MMNIMILGGHKAAIHYDPELDTFRGEFVGLNGGANFYGSTIKELRKEGELSLNTFFEMCKEEGINPCKEFSGRFNLRVPPELHAEIAMRAAAEGRGLNQYLMDLIKDRM